MRPHNNAPPPVALADLPLCVDCDGTLTPTDLLHESVLNMLKHAPLKLLMLPWWLLRGKAHMKAQIAATVTLDPRTLPLNAAVVEQIEQARANGRHVVLATASHESLARPLADHLGLFHEVLCSDGQTNLGGAAKAKALQQRFGARGFDYIGNSWSDVPVWALARQALVSSNSKRLQNAARNAAQSTLVLSPARATVRNYVKGLRLHQWLKNLLIFVPVLAAHQLRDSQKAAAALSAFLAFGLCASAVYVINDMLDLDADRQHARKRLRPFASGIIPLTQGAAMVPLLLAGSVVCTSRLPLAFAAVLGLYFCTTLIYSLRLKRQVVVDVMLLAGLYTLRVIAGGAAVAVVPSFWLLALSMFVFLSLALVKRYAEMRSALRQQTQAAAGRGYVVDDLPVLLSLGTSSGMVAAMIFALYIHSPETAAMYPSAQWLWGIPPLLLYWISRIWLKVHRGEVDEDPVVFAAKDWQRLVVIALGAATFFVAGIA
jgi:4-hydroxybenzoate polyprenyltransferase/phosphoserine phosphatase